MNLVGRPETPYMTARPEGAPDRVIRGVVLHHTGGWTAVRPHADGSWHYLIDRDGTIYRDVAEADCAWHARAADRWRPSWVGRDAGWTNGVSDVNACTLGIEIVGPGGDAGFTAAQEDALAELAADIEGRHGRLWWVGHGEIQTDRRLSEPDRLNWGAAGFGEREGDGRRRIAMATIDNDRAVLHALEETGYDANEAAELIKAASTWSANAASLSGWIEEIGALRQALDERDARIADLEARLRDAGYDPTTADATDAAPTDAEA